jgi:hypothetical protein
LRDAYVAAGGAGPCLQSYAQQFVCSPRLLRDQPVLTDACALESMVCWAVPCVACVLFI